MSLNSNYRKDIDPPFDKILQNVARYIYLIEDEIELFVSYLKPRNLRQHQFILEAGEICRYETFVNKGCLRSYFTDDKGNEHVVQFAIEDWWISDFDSTINNKPSLLSIDSLEKSEILQIAKADFDDLLVRVPKFERFFRIALQNAFISHQHRILSNISDTAKDKYLNFIRKYPLFEHRIPQKQLASYLGITPEFLSKIKKEILMEERKRIK